MSSKARSLARAVLPRRAINQIKAIEGRRRLAAGLKDLSSGKGVAWGPGYELYRSQLVSRTLADEVLMAKFRHKLPPPRAFGVGVDERCIEYPWFFARLNSQPERLLDAGGTLNHSFILNDPLLSSKQIHVMTLAPESDGLSDHDKAVCYICGDLRDIPVQSDFYDAIACLSTLEHVGFDNSGFTHKAPEEHRPDSYKEAMGELRRVLRPGGKLCLTVPFGVRQNFGTFHQFDKELLSGAIEAFGRTKTVTELFYQYTPDGWTLSQRSKCEACVYVEWVTRPEWPEPLPREPDGAAAARAVACVELVKV